LRALVGQALFLACIHFSSAAEPPFADAAPETSSASMSRRAVPKANTGALRREGCLMSRQAASVWMTGFAR